SQSKKSDLIKSLLVSCDAIEARYLMRALAGKLRNGLGEQSILVSLAHACTITVPATSSDEEILIDRFEKMRSNDQKIDEMKKILEKSNQLVKKAYYQCPNYSLVINAILEHGLDDLEKYCKLTPGVPLKPMLAYPTKGIHEVLKRFEDVEFTCEYKYDGERAQIHILEDGNVKIYSRNSENNTGKYPDIIEFLQEILHLKKTKKNDPEKEEISVEEKVTSAIIDAEVVAYDMEKKTIQPFQVLSTRKKKDAVSEEIKVRVCIFAFDLIYLNNKSLIDLPFRERRDKLYEHFPRVEGKLMFAEKMDANDVEAIQEFLDKSIKDGCEGLMIKTLDDEAHYEISKRSHNWLKLKKDYLEGVGDTLDLVVIGGYLGSGKRTGLYGGYLLACYDPENEEYQTICKLGTGLKDNDLQVQFESLSKIKIDRPKSYFRVNDTLEQPDHWFEPDQVWEIKCADFSLSPVHTAALGILDRGKGISLRFPRFLRLRDDKKAEDATTAEQVCEMYKNQQQMLNLNEKEKIENEEEDY
ncbi:DNA ligase 1, partial [Brachionus plicatilis]